MAVSALAGCNRLPGTGPDAMSLIIRDWRGAAMLAGQQHAVCDTVTVALPVASCGSVPAPTTERLAVYSALAARTAARPRAERTGTDLRTLALLDVAVDPSAERTLTRAIGFLAEAAQIPDASAEVLIDHSAIRLQRFARTHQVLDVILAIESATAALEREPSRLEASWNRALALTWAGMRGTAAAEWQRYDSLARRRGPARRPVVVDQVTVAPPAQMALSGRWRELTREHAWNVALPAHARALLAGAPDQISATGAVLDSVAVLAARDSVDGDIALVRDVLRVAATERDTASIRTVQNALDGYRWARSGAGRQSVGAASDTIDGLLRQPALPSPIRRWLLLEQANQLMIVGRSGEAMRQFTELTARAPASAALYRLRTASGAAIALASLGRTAESVTRLRQVEQGCARVVLEDCALGMTAMDAMYSAVLGDVQATEDGASRTITASARAPTTQWHWSAAFLLRQVAELHRAPRAVEVFDAEAIATAIRLDRNDLATAVAVERLSSTFERGDLPRATRLLQELRDRWVPSQSAEMQAWSRTTLLEFDARLRLGTAPAASVALLDTALELTKDDAIDARRTPIRVIHAMARLATGDTTTALVEMDDLFRRMRDRGEGRATVFDAARLARLLEGLAHSSAAVLRAQGSTVPALRALSGQPFLIDEPEACCAPSGKAAAIAVRLVGDSVWVWTPSSRGLALRVAFLPERVVRAAAALDTVALMAVHDAILAPEVSLRTAEALCVDVRGIASQLPWSALRDRARGRYLVEAMRLSRIDDAQRGCAASASRTGPASDEYVAVLDAAPASGPRALPASKREVLALRELWGRAARVTDATEGRAAALTAITLASVVHFAGHAILDQQRPERSYLLMGAGADSMITGATIAARRLPNAPLVVLGACDAGVGTVGTFGGFDSIAGAFLAAGARSVIGAAWPVEDEPTGSLMLVLHAALHAGASPADALRQAQLSALHSTDPALRSPRVWAAFQLMGSGG